MVKLLKIRSAHSAPIKSWQQIYTKLYIHCTFQQRTQRMITPYQPDTGWFQTTHFRSIDHD